MLDKALYRNYSNRSQSSERTKIPKQADVIPRAEYYLTFDPANEPQQQKL